MVLHSLLRILLISPVRIDWFAAETCGRRRRANIMNAFIGLFGVPSAFSVCDVNVEFSSETLLRGLECGIEERADHRYLPLSSACLETTRIFRRRDQTLSVGRYVRYVDHRRGNSCDVLAARAHPHYVRRQCSFENKSSRNTKVDSKR
jgi:hypothetical protein